MDIVISVPAWLVPSLSLAAWWLTLGSTGLLVLGVVCMRHVSIRKNNTPMARWPEGCKWVHMKGCGHWVAVMFFFWPLAAVVSACLWVDGTQQRDKLRRMQGIVTVKGCR